VMAKRDGDLRSIFRQHLPQAQWTSIETGAVSGGVPDSEYCFDGGAQGWIEFKKIDSGWFVKPTKSWVAQVAWISRRVRLGGRVYVAVRRQIARIDDLYLVCGADVARLRDDGLQGALWAAQFIGGPAHWDWSCVERMLKNELHPAWCGVRHA
jgi:hypothetical protein